MINPQKTLQLSPYSELYDMLVPADNFLRRMHDEIDFSFIYRELSEKYSPDMGRTAYCPVMMFKYMMLKVISKLSDIDLVEEVRVNMAYKYFLDMRPEEMPVDPSTICKFRRQRLKDVDLLELLLGKTFEMAEEAGIMVRREDSKIHVRAIVDGTHTVSPSSYYRPVPALKEWSKKLRYQLYACLPGLKGRVKSDRGIKATDLKGEMEYARSLVAFARSLGAVAELPRVRKVVNRLDEMVGDIMDHYSYSPTDPDARVGHKNSSTEFFGFKTQMVEDADSELILAARVTSGEVGDAIPGIEAVRAVLARPGFAVDELLGDAAYSGTPFINLARASGFELIAPPHPNLGSSIDGRDGFTFNKDADRFICPQGHLAVYQSVKRYKRDNGRESVSYTFDKDKCAVCPVRDTCLKGKKRTGGRTFTVTRLTKGQRDLLKRSQTEDFKRRRRERYKIEAKNSHLKRGLGFGKAMAHGIEMMGLQTAVTIFLSNIKKIYAKKR